MQLRASGEVISAGTSGYAPLGCLEAVPLLLLCDDASGGGVWNTTTRF